MFFHLQNKHLFQANGRGALFRYTDLAGLSVSDNALLCCDLLSNSTISMNGSLAHLYLCLFVMFLFTF